MYVTLSLHQLTSCGIFLRWGVIRDLSGPTESTDACPEPIANSALVEMLTPLPHGSRRDASSRQLSLF